MRLLRAHLNALQRRQFDEHGWFDVVGGQKVYVGIGSIARTSPTCKKLEPTARACRCSASGPAGICLSVMFCLRKRSPWKCLKAMRLQSRVDGRHLRRDATRACSSSYALLAARIEVKQPPSIPTLVPAALIAASRHNRCQVARWVRRTGGSVPTHT